MTVFFERIRTVHYLLVLFYLWRGYEVYAFDFDDSIKPPRWLRRLINAGKVERIIPNPWSIVHGQAIDQTELVYPKLKATGAQKSLRRFLKDEETDLVFKKMLLPEIFTCLYVNTHLGAVAKVMSQSRTVCFFHDKYNVFHRMLARHGTHDLDPLVHVRRPLWYTGVAPLLRWLDKISYALPRWGYLVSRTSLMAIGNLLPRREAEKLQASYAIPIEQRFQVAMSGKRYFDFLVDRTNITAANVLFLFRIPLDKSIRRHCDRNGYNVIEQRHLLGVRSLAGSRWAWSVILGYLAALMRIWPLDRQPRAFVAGVLQSIYIHMQHEALSKRATFKHYVYANQESARQVAVNIVLRKQGVTTWNYAMFIGGGFLHAKKGDFAAKRHTIWAFFNGDHYLGATQHAIDFYKLHCQTVRQYHDIGCIFSEMVREYLAETGKEGLARRFFARPLTKSQRVVSFFDTTFLDADNVPVNFWDGILFYEDILRFLADFQDAFVVVKPSKDEQIVGSPKSQWSSAKASGKLMAVWDTLKQHPRVHWAGTTGDVPAIIAASDLVVTHCLSSPTFEALGARRKAIWYESGEKHRGVLYDSIPGLIVHGYEQLREHVRHLLWEVSEDEYAAYLDEHIKNRVESFLDGRALSRFRRLLAGTAETERG